MISHGIHRVRRIGGYGRWCTVATASGNERHDGQSAEHPWTELYVESHTQLNQMVGQMVPFPGEPCVGAKKVTPGHE